jgi:putative tryptophan/tyrosine transport system substrate-binding protein
VVLGAGEAMRRREFILLIGSTAVAWPLTARAQQARKTHTIGLLSPAIPPSPATPTPYSAVGGPFSNGLRELGWIEGQNITIDRRYAENRLERLPELAAELVRLNVEVIVAVGTLGPLAAKRATSTIPIVMTAAGDPLGSGLVASLAQPGGNVTGMSLMVPDIAGKRLELLKEILPRLVRVAVLWNAANPYSANVFKEIQTAARRFGIEVQSLEVRSPDDFDGAFEDARRRHPDALIEVEDPLTNSLHRRIVEFAAAEQLPSLHGVGEEVKAGGLISYGASIPDLFRRAAGYVDKILKGAKPADLPVEQPTKFELVINLKTAKALGLTVPPSLLARADEVIE